MADEPTTEPEPSPPKRTRRTASTVRQGSDAPKRPRTRNITLSKPPEPESTLSPVIQPIKVNQKSVRWDWRRSYLVVSIIIPLLAGLAVELVLYCSEGEHRKSLIAYNTTLEHALNSLDPVTISRGFSQRLGDEYGTAFYTWAAPFNVGYQKREIEQAYSRQANPVIVSAQVALNDSMDLRLAENLIISRWIDSEQAELASINSTYSPKTLYSPQQSDASGLISKLTPPSPDASDGADDETQARRFALETAIRNDLSDAGRISNEQTIASMASEELIGPSYPKAPSESFNIDSAEAQSLQDQKRQFMRGELLKSPEYLAIATPAQDALNVAKTVHDHKFSALARHELPERWRNVPTYLILPGLVNGYIFIFDTLLSGGWIARSLGIFVLIMGALAVFPLAKGGTALFPIIGIPLPGGGFVPLGNESRGGCLPLRLVAVPLVGTGVAWFIWGLALLLTHLFTVLLAPQADVVAAVCSTPVSRFVVSHLAEHNLTEKAKMLLEGEVEHIIRRK